MNVTALHDASWIVVCSESELLPGTGSWSSAKMDAVLVTVPETLLVAVIVTVAVALAASTPMEHDTVPRLRLHEPCDEDAVVKVTPAGGVSVISTPTA